MSTNNETGSRADEEMTLTCPECSGKLRMKRRHFGIVGNCVHCRAKLVAEEDAEGNARMVNPDRTTHLPEKRHTSRNTPAAGLAMEAKKVETTPESTSVSPNSVPAEPEQQSVVSSPPSASARPTPPAEEELFSKKPASSDEETLFEGRRPDPSLSSGWGTKVPDGQHASISPFGTGSASSSPGLAESLYREKISSDEKASVPAAPVPAPTVQSFSTENLFTTIVPQTKEEPAKPEPPQEINLDELSESEREKLYEERDKMPLPELTAEKEAEMVAGMLSMNSDKPLRKKRSPGRLKKLIKSVAVMAILAGIGYGVMWFAPEETTAKWQDQIVEFVEPGRVLLDYVPSFEGKKESFSAGSKDSMIRNVKEKIGLNELTGKMSAYEATAREQLDIKGD